MSHHAPGRNDKAGFCHSERSEESLADFRAITRKEASLSLSDEVIQ